MFEMWQWVVPRLGGTKGKRWERARRRELLARAERRPLQTPTYPAGAREARRGGRPRAAAAPPRAPPERPPARSRRAVNLAAGPRLLAQHASGLGESGCDSEGIRGQARPGDSVVLVRQKYLRATNNLR